jgi:hypothetical protein
LWGIKKKFSAFKIVENKGIQSKKKKKILNEITVLMVNFTVVSNPVCGNCCEIKNAHPRK